MMNHGFSGRLTDALPRLTLILCILQPLLDVLSYWLDALGIPNTLTLILRFAMLLCLVCAGFLLSRRRWLYWTAFALCALLTAGHTWACLQTGYDHVLEDWANLLRIYQLPLSTLCLITFLRANDQVYHALRRGIFWCLAIIATVEVLSLITNTNPYTYPNKSIGLLGWFYFANAQSAILSMAVPVSIVFVLERPRCKLRMQCLYILFAFAILYFFGTRLSYLALVATGIGLAITLLIAGRSKKRTIGILLACTALCLVCLPVSPMYRNQVQVQENALQKQENIDALIAEDEADAQADGLTGQDYTLARLSGAYEFHLGGLVHRFGLPRVAERYDYSESAGDLADIRRMRISYCALLLEDSPALSRWFGLELGDLTYEGYIYDVENDLYGIYFLCGGVGLGLMLLFLGYFLVRIIVALCRNFRQVFTLQAGGWGIALLTCLTHVYSTAGVLRRPNASFYLAVTLVCILHLIQQAPAKGRNVT